MGKRKSSFLYIKLRIMIWELVQDRRSRRPVLTNLFSWSPPIVIIMREKDIPRRAGMLKLSAEKEQQLTAMLAAWIRKGAKRLGPWRSPSAPRGRGRRTTHCTAAVQPQVPCPGGQAQLVDVAHPKVQAVHSWHLTTRTNVSVFTNLRPTCTITTSCGR